MKYECIKTFWVEMFDNDGFSLDGKCKVIEKGSLWERDSDTHRIVGGKETVHLDSTTGGEWLEITESSLNKYFREVQHGKE